jgi:hypothetical protein
MAVIPLGDGKGITWEPTDELICAKCREPFDPATSLTNVFLMANENDRYSGMDIRIGRYWYLHDACRAIEQRLKEMGANIRWRTFDMPFILGFFIEKSGYRRIAGNREKRHEWLKPGVYTKLIEQWRPALRGLDTHVTETLDITTLALETSPSPLAKVIALVAPALEEKPGWLALRFATLKRDKYRCRLCGTTAEDGDHVRLEVDHRIARANGGTDEPGNLWTLCFSCNRGKGTQAL